MEGEEFETMNTGSTSEAICCCEGKQRYRAVSGVGRVKVLLLLSWMGLGLYFGCF